MQNFNMNSEYTDFDDEYKPYDEDEEEEFDESDW